MSPRWGEAIETHRGQGVTGVGIRGAGGGEHGQGHRPTSGRGTRREDRRQREKFVSAAYLRSSSLGVTLHYGNGA